MKLSIVSNLHSASMVNWSFFFLVKLSRQRDALDLIQYLRLRALRRRQVNPQNLSGRVILQSLFGFSRRLRLFLPIGRRHIFRFLSLRGQRRHLLRLPLCHRVLRGVHAPNFVVIPSELFVISVLLFSSPILRRVVSSVLSVFGFPVFGLFVL